MTRCPTCGCATISAGDPSPAEARALEVILSFHERHGRFPTYREIQRELLLESIQAVCYQVDGLTQKGFITKNPRRGHRAILAARSAIAPTAGETK